MGFSLDISVPALTVFIQGLVSFFSPCVLPLIPLYIGYLSGGTGKRGEDGRMHYERSKVMLHTLCFVIGVSFAFFLLGLGFSTLGTFFKSNQLLFARVGGILVVLFGFYQLGFFGKSGAMGKEHRLPFKLDMLAMSPITALIMGFTFSFAWTPCVGPALASVLLMAASASTKALAFGLIGVYTLGFVLPFLAVGLFTTSLLEFFKTHGNVVKYTVKVGGILMIFMGLLMFTGRMNAVTGYLSRFQTQSSVQGSKEPGEGGDKTPVKSPRLKDILCTHWENIHLVHTEVDNVPHTIAELDSGTLTEAGKKAWADVLNAKVERVYQGLYGLQMELSGVKPGRLEAFSGMLGGYCSEQEYETWVNEPEREPVSPQLNNS